VSSSPPENNKISIPLEKKDSKPEKQKNILDLISNSLNGKAETKGKLYIPYKNDMVTLNLEKTPFIKSKKFPRFFFFEKNELNKNQRNIIKKFYKNAVFFNLSNKIENKKKELKKEIIKDAYGIKSEINYNNKIHSTLDSSKHFEIFTTENYYKAPYNFLKYFTGEKNIILPSKNRTKSKKNSASLESTDQKIFVKNLLKTVGCKYNEDTEISFPYNNIQIKAYTNIAKNPEDKFLIIDFNEFYGDTIESIKKINMDVSTISPNDSYKTIVAEICSKLGFKVVSDPLLPNAAGKSNLNINLEIPGLFVINHFDKKNPWLFFTSIPSLKLPEYVLHYLDWLNVKIIFI
ncbi:MAG: hypothetical protein ACQER9_04750, partial [Nanobdellota archaeon]